MVTCQQNHYVVCLLMRKNLFTFAQSKLFSKVNTELFVSHSYVRCLRQGVAFSLKNMGAILLYSLPMLLLLAIVGILSDNKFFMVLARGEEAGVVGYCSLVLFVLSVLLLQTSIVWQQHHLGASGTLPKGCSRRESRPMLNLFLRNVSVSIVNALFVGCVGFAMWLGAKKMFSVAKSADMPTFGWIGVGVSGVLLFLILLGLFAFLQLLWANYLYGNQRFFDTLRVTLRGTHHLGRTTALQFVQMVYALIVLTVFCLPYVLFVVMENLAQQTLAQGDVMSLPAYYTYLHGAALFMGGLGIAITLALTLYPTLYNWCAIQSEAEAA